MNLYSHYQRIVQERLRDLAQAGTLPAGLDAANVTVEPPRDPSMGDLATNAALVLAKQAKMKPRELAELLAEALAAEPDVVGVDIAGPGFVNLRLADDVWRRQLRAILELGSAYGRSELGAGEAVNVEYVSANPTGPLHLGHVRGAVYGDALATLLEQAGYRVCREYYINDAGVQVDTLARSVHLRYRQALGEDIGEIPEGMYPGDYLIPVAEALIARDGARWRDADESEWLPVLRRFAVDEMMALIKRDLAALGVDQEVFLSEQSLRDQGQVDGALAALDAKGLIYQGVLEPPKGKVPEDWEPRPQTLFRASQFGDDVDRPLKKSDGSWTYFAADIACHFDKYERGFRRMIDVFGADHGGYVKRMKAAVKALSDSEAALDIKLCQMVRLMRGGQPVKMSKRAGEFVTLRELVDEVGKDVVRFLMLTRKNDAPLDFDFEKVTEQSKDNPVFYVQYANARIHSVFRNAAEQFPMLARDDAGLAAAALDRIDDSSEFELIRQLSLWPRLVETAAQANEPHRIAFYLNDLASSFHALWNKGNDNPSLRFIIADDPELTAARLAMIRAVAIVIAAGLAVMGVEPVDEMR